MEIKETTEGKTSENGEMDVMREVDRVGSGRKNRPYLSWHTFHCDKSENSIR